MMYLGRLLRDESDRCCPVCFPPLLCREVSGWQVIGERGVAVIVPQILPVELATEAEVIGNLASGQRGLKVVNHAVPAGAGPGDGQWIIDAVEGVIEVEDGAVTIRFKIKPQVLIGP